MPRVAAQAPKNANRTSIGWKQLSVNASVKRGFSVLFQAVMNPHINESAVMTAIGPRDVAMCAHAEIRAGPDPPMMAGNRFLHHGLGSVSSGS